MACSIWRPAITTKPGTRKKTTTAHQQKRPSFAESKSNRHGWHEHAVRLFTLCYQQACTAGFVPELGQCPRTCACSRRTLHGRYTRSLCWRLPYSRPTAVQSTLPELPLSTTRQLPDFWRKRKALHRSNGFESHLKRPGLFVAEPQILGQDASHAALAHLGKILKPLQCRSCITTALRVFVLGNPALGAPKTTTRIAGSCDAWPRFVVSMLPSQAEASPCLFHLLPCSNGCWAPGSGLQGPKLLLAVELSRRGLHVVGGICRGGLPCLAIVILRGQKCSEAVAGPRDRRMATV